MRAEVLGQIDPSRRRGSVLRGPGSGAGPILLRRLPCIQSLEERRRAPRRDVAGPHHLQCVPIRVAFGVARVAQVAETGSGHGGHGRHVADVPRGDRRAQRAAREEAHGIAMRDMADLVDEHRRDRIVVFTCELDDLIGDDDQTAGQRERVRRAEMPEEELDRRIVLRQVQRREALGDPVAPRQRQRRRAEEPLLVERPEHLSAQRLVPAARCPVDHPVRDPRNSPTVGGDHDGRERDRDHDDLPGPRDETLGGGRAVAEFGEQRFGGRAVVDLAKTAVGECDARGAAGASQGQRECGARDASVDRAAVDPQERAVDRRRRRPGPARRAVEVAAARHAGHVRAKGRARTVRPTPRRPRRPARHRPTSGGRRCRRSTAASRSGIASTALRRTARRGRALRP